MMIVECQNRREIDFKSEDKIDKIKPHSHCFLSPQSTRFRTPSTWRPSQCCLFRLPCSLRFSSTNDAPIAQIYKIEMKISSIIHTSKTKFHNYQDMLVSFLYRCALINFNLAAQIVSHGLFSLVRPLLSHQRFSWKKNVCFIICMLLQPIFLHNWFSRILIWCTMKYDF